MASLPIFSTTIDEYLAWEMESASKHEYFDGKVVAMAGASFTHALIVSNLSRILAEHLTETPCREFGSDLRVSAAAGRLICYPDITVACSPFEFLPDAPETLTNPVFLIEVLSQSTRANDRGYKLPFYREIPSVRGYLLIEQDRVSVEYGRRISGAQWHVELTADRTAVLDLAPIRCQTAVSRIYSGVETLA
ncbi:MAG: Uma2 family endonuclease [Acidobacteriota bacterium]|nr:Uma2 family endonuclease [Acidobacteriota bacterium]